MSLGSTGFVNGLAHLNHIRFWSMVWA